MKNAELKETGKVSFRTVRSGFCITAKAAVFFLAVSYILSGCKKDAGLGDPEQSGSKDRAATSATPSGNPTVSVYPVRGPHNHGWNSGLTSTGPYTCDNQYSNEDFIGSGSNAHYGNDIFGALGTPIVSPVAGTLVTVVNTTNNGLGRHVYIKQANGWHHVLGHMNTLASGLAVGQTVMPGQPMGTMGATGTNSGGSVHLHYSINHGPGLWSTGIDPWPYIYPVENNVCTSVKALNPVADAYIADGTNANTNYGSATLLRIQDGSSLKQSVYFKFDVSSVATVGTAKLRFYGKSNPGVNVTTRVYGVNTDSWTEGGLTWNNAPAPSGSFLSSVTVNSLKYYEFDVTGFVQAQAAGDDIVTLNVYQFAGANIATQWNSREQPGNRPELIITY